MDFIKWSISRPVSVAVGVLLVVLFGLIGVTAIPIQLTPTVDRAVITVSTIWPGRSPQEIVDEITKEQEEQLKNVKNLKTMRSVSREGACEITLEFYIGADITRARQEVSDALRQVSDYPDEVDEPTIQSSEGTPEQAIAWIIIDLDPEKVSMHPGFDVSTLFTAMDREVKPFIERIDGVAEVNIYGGREKEARVLLDPTRLAQRGVSYREVIASLNAENENISAGTIAEGKRDYRVRVVGQYESPDEVLDTIVAWRAPSAGATPVPVFVRDVGTVEIGHQKARGFVRSMGQPCLAMNVIRQAGSNVMSVMEGVRERLEVVKTDFLPRIDPVVGPDLRLRQVYDETEYIRSAIDLVLGNLWIGGALAVVVLLCFLRSIKSVAVIALAIPISIIGTFLVMLLAGRTLNVISLAGLAFATGMVVDNAIVVLENIDRRRSLGDAPMLAVYRGAKEVWGAILASTLTTVAVFIPVLTIREEAGQIFFDLTLAMAVSVSLSLVVAATVVPAATALLFRGARARAASDVPTRGHPIKELFGLAPLCGAIVNRFGDFIHWSMTSWRAWTVRPAIILALTGISLLGARYLAPPLDYLPAGNRNLVFGGMLVPPGLSIEQLTSYANQIESRVGGYIGKDTTDPAIRASLQPIMRFEAPTEPFDPVGIENFFIGAFDGGMFVGGTSMEPQRVIPIGSLLTANMNGLPDAYGGARQASIFGGFRGGNSIDIEVSGPRLDRVTSAAQMIFMSAAGKYGFGDTRANPANFNLSQPEWRVRLTDAGRELGLRTSDVGTAVRALFDGAYAGDYLLDGRKIDLKVLPLGDTGRGRLEYKEQLSSVPVVTPAGRVVPIDSVVELIPSLAPQEISRIEELPSVSVQIVPPKGQTIEEVMADLESTIIAPARQAGLIDPSMRVRLEGTAAKLDEVKASLFGARLEGAARGDLWWQRVLEVLSGVLVIAGLAVGLMSLSKWSRATGTSRQTFAYGAVGAALLGLTLGGLLLGLALEPQLLMARFIWALLVTYLLMAALFESFMHPFVIMFSVPLAVVGGFAALRIVHEWTLANPTIAPQQMDVLTMIGFVILIGTVVNNAILLVEQAIHFMHPQRMEGFEDQRALPPFEAIAQSVRTRIRPIFMTTLTTLGGGLPLVVSPGAGSEMYRGLGAVVIGGLFVSTIFTLVLVPLLFSLVLEMREGVIATLFGRRDGSHAHDEPADRDGTLISEPKSARRPEMSLGTA